MLGTIIETLKITHTVWANTAGVYVIELNLLFSLTRSWIITCPRCALWAQSTLHVFLLARPRAAQLAQLTPGNRSKDCTWKGVMRWDVLQWAGKWRSAHHSWVMRRHALKHCTSPCASLHSASVSQSPCISLEPRYMLLFFFSLPAPGSQALILRSYSCIARK